jgi:pimeloyl-ACP methyl ester carboxylesterase
VTAQHASGPRPTIVLVHGAWANGASWDAVVRRLQADGCTVDVPANPLQGLAFDPAYIADFLHSITGSCVVAADPTTIFNLATYPGAPAGVFDAYYKQSLFPACFANGLPLAEARALGAAAEPLSTIALGQPSGVPAWKTIPSWAVVGTADRVIPPALQLTMAQHAHAHITEVHAPHLSMISSPGVVTRVILEAVHATG